MITVDLALPERVLAVGAHPDDIEFGCAATLTKWADAGSQVHVCICTDGSKGTWDPSADLEALVNRREEEQRDAAAVLGAKDVHFLGYVDGELTNDAPARAAVCELIRRVRPDVLVTHDPWRAYRLHPDHHHAGMLTIEAFVAARDPHFFPEQQLAPHRPNTLLLFETATPDHVERVDDYVKRKVEALLRHRSQWQSTMGIHEQPEEQQRHFVQAIFDEAQADGIRAGVRFAEAFRRIDDP